MLGAATRPGIFRDNLILFGLSMVVNALGLAFQFVMARLLSPGEWAEMVAALSLMALLSVPGSALNTLVVKVAGDLYVRGQGDRLWRWIVETGLRVGAVGAFIAVALGFTSGWISSLLQFDGLTSVFAVGSAIFLSLLAIVPKGALAGTSSFFMLGMVGVVETLSRLLSGAGLVIFGWSAAGAVAGTSVGAAVTIVVGGFALFRVARRAKESGAAEARSMLGRGDQLRVVAISLALVVILNADVLLVKHYFSDIQAANYSAVALIGRTLFFATAPVSVVLLPHVIRRYSAGQSIVPSLLVSVSLILTIIAVVTIILVIFPTQVFAVAFPDAYDLDMTLLSIYIVAGSLLALNYALAHLHIGAGNLGPWRVMLLAAAGMVAAMFIWHGTVQELAKVLTVTLSISTAYLVIETIRLVRGTGEG